jgi:hypothetical protein
LKVALLPTPVTTGMCHLYDCYCEIARYSLTYEAEGLFEDTYVMDSDEECSDADEENARQERFETEVDESITSIAREFNSKIRAIEGEYQMAITALLSTDCQGLGTLIDVIQESIRDIGFEIGKQETRLLERYLGVPQMKYLCVDGHTDSPVAKLWALERLQHVGEGSYDNSVLGIGVHFARYIFADMSDSESESTSGQDD